MPWTGSPAALPRLVTPALCALRSTLHHPEVQRQSALPLCPRVYWRDQVRTHTLEDDGKHHAFEQEDQKGDDKDYADVNIGVEICWHDQNCMGCSGHTSNPGLRAKIGKSRQKRIHKVGPDTLLVPGRKTC
jgi:hypothetical protein